MKSAPSEALPDFFEISSNSKKALKIMEDNQIAPNPRNYSIWYHYAQADDSTLTQEIDRAIEGGVTFDDNVSSYIYDKYLLNDENNLNKVANESTQTKQILNDIFNSVSKLSGNADEYQQQMEQHISSLRNVGDSKNIAELLSKIIKSSVALRENSLQMQKKLDESQQEVSNLRQTLAKTTAEAERDFLTGVYNRKVLDKRFDELSTIANEQKTPLSLLMVDIDFFKKLNDKHGHLIGDEALKIVARILNDGVRGKDVIARYGGEEFAILLPNTPLQGAMVVADSLRQAIARKEIKRTDTDEMIGRITVSIGTTEWKPEIDSVPLFIKRADSALYRAKHEGRNRVIGEI